MFRSCYFLSTILYSLIFIHPVFAKNSDIYDYNLYAKEKLIYSDATLDSAKTPPVMPDAQDKINEAKKATSDIPKPENEISDIKGQVSDYKKNLNDTLQEAQDNMNNVNNIKKDNQQDLENGNKKQLITDNKAIMYNKKIKTIKNTTGLDADEIVIVKNKYYKQRNPALEEDNNKKFYSPALPPPVFDNKPQIIEKPVDKKNTPVLDNKKSKIEEWLRYLFAPDKYQKFGTIYADLGTSMDLFGTTEVTLTSVEQMSRTSTTTYALTNNFSVNNTAKPIFISLALGAHYNNYLRAEVRLFDLEFTSNSINGYTLLNSQATSSTTFMFNYNDNIATGTYNASGYPINGWYSFTGGIHRIIGAMGNVMIDSNRTKRMFFSLGGGVGIGRFSFYGNNIQSDVDLAYNAVFQVNLRLSTNLVIYCETRYIGFMDKTFNVTNPISTNSGAYMASDGTITGGVLPDNRSLDVNQARMSGLNIYTFGVGVRLYLF